MIFITVPGKGKDSLYSLAGAFLLLALWQALASFGGTGFLLPPPGRVLVTLVRLFSDPSSWTAVLTSAFRILRSVLLAVLLAILLAWFASRSRPLRLLLAPANLVMKSVPIVSFILLALFFMGDSLLTSFICGLIVFPLLYSQLLTAFSNLDRGLLEMGRVFSLTRGEVIRYIVLPASRDPFLAAVSVAVGMAWKAGVAAEVLAFARGTIGRHMHEAKLYLDMEGLLAWTLALVLVAFLSEQVLVRAFRLTLTELGKRLPRTGGKKKTGPAPVSSFLDKRLEEGEELLCPVEGQAIKLRSFLCLKDAPADDSLPAIQIRGISKCFGSSYVFSDYSARLPLHRPLVISGPSGVGKTTLMRMIAGLLAPDLGTIEGVPERGLFVFQDNRLLPQLSARDNIRLVLPAYDGERADLLLKALDLTSVADQEAESLSGGEKRRLALVRALAPDSDILYLDEAFRELDEKHEQEALDLLLSMAGDKAVILATHDLTLVNRLDANHLELRK